MKTQRPSKSLYNQDLFNKTKEQLIEDIEALQTRLYQLNEFVKNHTGVDPSLNERSGSLNLANDFVYIGSWEFNVNTKKFKGDDEVKQIFGFEIHRIDFDLEE